MWKYVSRSIRNTLKRQKYHLSNSRRNKNGFRSPKSENEYNKFLTPSVVNFKSNGFGSAKENKTHRDEFNWETKHSWQDAVRWTGVVAIGWAVCQSLCLRKKLDEFWNKSKGQIPIDLNFLKMDIQNFEPKKMLSISQFKNVENPDDTDPIPIAFGSINSEEFDMLIHRQQSF